MLKEWINQDYLLDSYIHKINRLYSNAKPFQHFVFLDFFNESKLKELKKAVLKEKFERIDKDLFSFSQTKELFTSDNKIIRNFYKFLSSKEFIAFIQKITSVKLDSKIDMHSHIFSDTDYLLFHDDVVESRGVAYVINLSEDFSHDDGGRLQLYDINDAFSPSKEIIPEFNSFVLFTVSKNSLHSIEEVKSNKKRITVSGWFHGY
ncbi:MAG: 2OG-Fe(II) oxygenase family protein [Nanoarchaeota archaeon]